MKRIVFLLLFSFFFIKGISQTQNEWITDLDTLKHQFLQKKWLFNPFLKQQFIQKLESLKNNNPQNLENQYWQIVDLLRIFKQPTIQIKNIDFKKFPFRVKEFDGNYYLTSIDPNFENSLGVIIQKINGIAINSIVQKIQNVSDISTKSFLKHYKINKTDTLSLNIQQNKKQVVKLFFNEIENSNELTPIIPKNTPFYLQKQDRWFWSYGINYGQQIYFKLNRGLSKEFLQQMKDSLQITDYQLAKRYHLSLQTVYDAPTFNNFTKKLFQKLKKRRYKKLFIDVRNLKIGDSRMLNSFIKKLQKLKRINRKARLFLFVDKDLSVAAMNIVMLFKEKTNATIIGESIKQIACNSNKIKELVLPNSRFIITYPMENFEVIHVKPKIQVAYTFSQFVNGIDPILQKVLEE